MGGAVGWIVEMLFKFMLEVIVPGHTQVFILHLGLREEIKVR
jgi:hypothetical protein